MARSFSRGSDEGTRIKLTYELLNAKPFAHLKSAFLKDLNFRSR